MLYGGQGVFGTGIFEACSSSLGRSTGTSLFSRGAEIEVPEFVCQGLFPACAWDRTRKETKLAIVDRIDAGSCLRGGPAGSFLAPAGVLEEAKTLPLSLMAIAQLT